MLNRSWRLPRSLSREELYEECSRYTKQIGEAAATVQNCLWDLEDLVELLADAKSPSW